MIGGEDDEISGGQAGRNVLDDEASDENQSSQEGGVCEDDGTGSSNGGMSSEDDAGTSSEDDGGMSSEDDGGMSSQDDGGMSSEDDGGAGTSSIDGTSIGGGPNQSIAPPVDLATDICLWPHSIIQLLDVALGGDDVTAPDVPDSKPFLSGGSFEIHRYDEHQLGHLGESEYFEVKGSVIFQVDGVWTTDSGHLAIGWDQGLGAAISGTFTSENGRWAFSPEIRVGVPVNKSRETTQGVGFSGGFKGTYTFPIHASGAESSDFVASVEVLFDVIECERASATDDWDISVANMEVTLGGGWQGTLNNPGGITGQFQGSYSLNYKAVVEPNWGAIIKEAIRQYGEDLLLETVATVAIPVAIVVGGVATVAIGVYELLQAWALQDMRDQIIPACSNATAKGYMAGLRGESSGDAAAKVTDSETAFKAGAAAGHKQRAKVVAEKCNGDAAQFDRWLQENASTVESQTRSQAKVMVQQQMWAQKATEYKNGGGPASSKLENQYYAWVYMIGNSPASMGGQWQKLWNDNRVAADDYPDRSAGNW